MSKNKGLDQPKKLGFGLVVETYVSKNAHETHFEEGVFTGIEWDMCTYAADSMNFGFVHVFFGENDIARSYVLSMTILMGNMMNWVVA